MNYAVFFGGGFGQQIKETFKGFFTQYSRFHGACVIRVLDPRTLPLWDRVLGKKVTLSKEPVEWETPNLFAVRRYPKGSLIWGSMGDSNPYVIFIPVDSFESGVNAVKSGLVSETQRFTIQDFIEEKKQKSWSEYDHNVWSPLFGTTWMDSSQLPPKKVEYYNGGKTFASMEEAKENQKVRFENRPEGKLPGDWNTIMTVETWSL